MKRVRFSMLAVLVLTAVVMTGSGSPVQALTLPCMFAGVVADEFGTPIAGATVTFVGLANKITNSAGIYTYSSTNGSVQIYASASGFVTSATETVVSVPGGSVVKNFTLYKPHAAGQYTRVAVDSAGKTHMAYYENKSMTYATDLSGTWRKYVIDTTDTGTHADLAIDSAGVVHLSYYDVANKRLKYATNAGSVWQTEVVDAGSANIGLFTSVTVDAANVPTIVYYDATNTTFKRATKSSGVWVTSVDPIHVQIGAAGTPSIP